jgi:hypothetical protein
LVQGIGGAIQALAWNAPQRGVDGQYDFCMELLEAILFGLTSPTRPWAFPTRSMPPGQYR